ncbi:hypothetical protein, partial [Roseisolibacter sp. H3M3-2]|uniref:helix-turn-helix domain-containing protein n=1 Tax=Roseisolibacter sp. H3M3-2 TaxID=3031323 RepID=UPI0023DA7382
MLTPGDYLRLRREAAGLTIEDVASRIDSWPHVPHRDRVAWLKSIESGIAPLSPGNAILLRFVFRFDPIVLDALADIAAGAVIPAPDICRLCGCSEHDACGSAQEPCAWVDAAKTVCSTCSLLLADPDETRPGTI